MAGDGHGSDVWTSGNTKLDPAGIAKGRGGAPDRRGLPLRTLFIGLSVYCSGLQHVGSTAIHSGGKG